VFREGVEYYCASGAQVLRIASMILKKCVIYINYILFYELPYLLLNNICYFIIFTLPVL